MRGLIATLLMCAVSGPCLAENLSQIVLKREPHFLSPYSVVIVDNGMCGVGNALKVTGALGTMRRKKVCVPLPVRRIQASLSSVTQ
jgi:hypothetical protein